MKLLWVPCFLGIVPGASYLFALAGEPSHLWLWRDVLGIM